MFWVRSLVVAFICILSAGAKAQVGCVPNPNANGPPFVNGCPIPASVLNAIGFVVQVGQFAGVDLTGVNDSSAALQNCLNAAGVGGTCQLNPGAKIRVLSNITIPAQTTLDCAETFADEGSLVGPAIRLAAAKSFLYGGVNAAIHNCLILPDGMTFPQSSSSSWTGTAINTQGNNAPEVINTEIAGFDTAILASGSGRVFFSKIVADGNGVTNGGVIVTGGNGDLGTLYDVKLQVVASSLLGCARIRQGTGFYFLNDGGERGYALIAQDFQTNAVNIVGANSIHISDLWTDYAVGNGCTPGTSVGVRIQTGTDLHFDHLDLNGTQTGLQIVNQANNATVQLGDVFCNMIGQDGISLGGAGGSNSGGNVSIVTLRGNNLATPNAVGRYYVNYLDTAGFTQLDILSGTLVKGASTPYINVPSGTFTYRIGISDHIHTDLTNPASLYGATTVGGCTGLGTGSCNLSGVAQTRSSPWAGTITLAPTGSPAANGVAVLTWPITPGNLSGCVLTLGNGSAIWPGPSTVQALLVTALTTQISWNTNGAALSAGSTYEINFSCFPQ